MESRIISIYAHEHDTEYWYDINKCLIDQGYFYESQDRGKNKMQINVGDDIYLLCRYSGDRAEIKFKCRVEQVNIPNDSDCLLTEDEYVHNDDGVKSSAYFKARLIEIYKNGTFPLQTLRILDLVSRHYQLNGDKVSSELIAYIEENKYKNE